MPGIAVSLPPDLERLAGEAIAAGRYRDLSEVVQAGIALLRPYRAKDGSAKISFLIDT